MDGRKEDSGIREEIVSGDARFSNKSIQHLRARRTTIVLATAGLAVAPIAAPDDV